MSIYFSVSGLAEDRSDSGERGEGENRRQKESE